MSKTAKTKVVTKSAKGRASLSSKSKQPAPKAVTVVDAPKIAAEALANRHTEVRTRIKALVASTEKDNVELAKLLYEAHTKGYATLWGYDGFKDYAQSELSIGARKAFYFVNIMSAIKACGNAVDAEKLFRLGWTKTRELASIMVEDNAKEWVDRAAELSVRELADTVKAARVMRKTESAAAPPSSVTSMRFALTEDEAAPVLDALRSAKDMLGCERDGTALAHVALFFMEHHAVVPRHTSLAALLTWINGVYNVNLELPPAYQGDKTNYAVGPGEGAYLGDTDADGEDEDDEDEDYNDEDDEEAPAGSPAR